MLLDLTVTFNKEAGKRESGKAGKRPERRAYLRTPAPSRSGLFMRDSQVLSASFFDEYDLKSAGGTQSMLWGRGRGATRLSSEK